MRVINQSINQSSNDSGLFFLGSLDSCCETGFEGTIGESSFKLTALRFHWWVSVSILGTPETPRSAWSTPQTPPSNSVLYSSFFLPCKPCREYQLLSQQLTTDLIFCAERKYTRSKQYPYSVERYICRTATSAFSLQPTTRARHRNRENLPTMIQPFHRRAKTAPSHYPRVPFHLLRFGQLLSSLVVGGIMSFFMYHLTHDHWKTPWTFILVNLVHNKKTTISPPC